MNWKKKKALTPIFFIFLLLLSGCGENSAVSFHEFAMDTQFSVNLNIKDSASETSVAADIRTLLQELQASFDCHTPDSTLSKLNQYGSLTEESQHIAALTSKVLSLESVYGNAVQLSCRPLTKLWRIGESDAAVPPQSEIDHALSMIDDTKIQISGQQIHLPDHMELDFGAAAKGYALDCIAQYLAAKDSVYGIVDVHSAILLCGQKPQNAPFRIAVSDPIDDGYCGTLLISNAAESDCTFVCTAGDAERYSVINGEKFGHIFDLSTGYPAVSDLASVTVVSNSGLTADYLSTRIYLGGSSELPQHLSAQDYAVLAVAKDGTVSCSPTLHFEVSP